MSPLEVPSRIPPHNLDAERAVLGAVLLEGREALPRVIEILRHTDFYTEAHRAIFTVMQMLFDRGQPVDVITLGEELRRAGQLEFVGGPAALALLVEQASIASHLIAYSHIVRDMAVLRELIQTSTQIISQAFEAKEDVQGLVDDAERRIFGLAERRLEGSALPVGRILKNTFEYIERLYERKEHVTGVATGFEKLDLETSGFQPSDFIIIAGRPSMGKAQPLDARVKTRTGWKRMGELRVGDELASVDGLRSRVAAVFPQGEQPIYRVTFSDGRSTECTADHLWTVHYRSWNRPRTLTTERVAEMLGRQRYRHRLWIDTATGEHGHAAALPIDPWLLGALLGDAKLSGERPVTSAAWADLLARLLERAGRRDLGHGDVTTALRWLGLLDVPGHETFIPDLYLTAPRGARLELLSGLLDGGGDLERGGRARFCSTSERLARDVADLARSLGGWCSVRDRTAGRPAFVCDVHPVEPKASVGPAVGPRRRPVFASIERVRVAQAQCIAVTHPSGLYITDHHVVTHNTAFALNIAQHVGVNLRGTVLVLSLEMSAPQLVQRMLCSEAKVDSQAVRTGYLSASDWARLTSAAGRLSEAKIFIDDSPGVTVLEARAKARRMKAEHGLDLLVIDYLQLMRGRSNMENRQQEISEISRSLKALAKEINVPVVALSQLSRAVEARAQRDFRPQLSDLRECVTGETLVVLADGRRVPIRDLVGTAPEVLAVSPEEKIVAAKSDRIWRVGTRAVVEVRLASGRAIRATAEHRLLSGRGWQRIEGLGVGDRLAIARRLPQPLFPQEWLERRVALLGQLIGDGSYLVNQPMRYTTSSEENSGVVREAVESAGKPGYRPAFFVNVSGTADQQRFLDTVGAFGPRTAPARRLAGLLATRRATTNVDTLPAEDFGRVKALMRQRGILQRRMAALRGTAYGGTAHFKFAPSRRVLAQYAEILDDDALRARATSDIFWDRIVAIEPAGVEEVFDLTVPGPASWLADGIVSHNSGALEQDSDLILFLYRQKVYKEDVPPDEENIAEVIIGKQRNGPIGTVKVVFLPQYARFENVADVHRQPQHSPSF